MTRRAKFAIGLTLMCLLACAVASRPVILNHISKSFYWRTGRTPATVGLSDRLKIPSGPGSCACPCLLSASGRRPDFSRCYGNHFRVGFGAKVSLRTLCSSVVFDYSGHGDSTRPGTISHLDEDAIPAYATFVSQFPGERLCVLGHSMGNAPLLESLPRFLPPPSCVVVANAFSSLRDAGRRLGTSGLLLYAIPDVWDDIENAKRVRVPLLVVYSDADTVNPPDMGRRIFEAAPEPKQLAVLHGFPHNAIYRTPTDEWWAPVLRFLQPQRQEG